MIYKKSVKIEDASMSASQNTQSPTPESGVVDNINLDNNLNRREFVGMLGVATATLWGIYPLKANAGQTTLNLTGTASNFNLTLPVSGSELWYDPQSLSSYSNGASITTWSNSGSMGSNYDLHNPTSFTGAANTVISPLKATYLGFPCAQFVFGGGTSSASGWAFRGQLATPTNSNMYWYINGNSSNGKVPNAMTFFSVFYTAQSYYGFWGNYVPASLVPSGIDGGYNISSFYLTGTTFYLNDKSDIAAGSVAFPDLTNQFTSIGYRYNPTGNVANIYQNKTSAAVTFNPTNPSSYCLAPWGIGMAGRYPNVGYLFEQVAYNRTLSDAEITTLRNYFASKYGGNTNS